MIAPSDPDYQDTKLIKQGKKTLSSPLKEIVEWAGSTFGAKVLNAYCDVVYVNHINRPRLTIIVEYAADLPKFKDGFNFDKVKQKRTTDEFRTILSSQKIKFEDQFSRESSSDPNKPIDPDAFFAVFTAFEPVAKWEANQSIPKEKIEDLQKNLKHDDLWTISRAGGSTIFFFYTDEQVKAAKTHGSMERIQDAYFELLTRYDEFKYFDSRTFSVSSDSKEIFDSKYKSSWFNYYR